MMKIYVWKSYATGELLKVGETELDDYFKKEEVIRELIKSKKLRNIGEFIVLLECDNRIDIYIYYNGVNKWQDNLISYWNLKKYIKILSEEKKIDMATKKNEQIKILLTLLSDGYKNLKTEKFNDKIRKLTVDCLNKIFDGKLTEKELDELVSRMVDAGFPCIGFPKGFAELVD